jgi:hypothetical protein
MPSAEVSLKHQTLKKKKKKKHLRIFATEHHHLSDSQLACDRRGNEVLQGKTTREKDMLY